MCGLAVALDYIGDRWTLLIVRELLISPRGFSQLQDTLTGCSPNLLVGRLKDMIQSGLIQHRSEVSSKSKKDLYFLTDLGFTLKESVESLVRWGGALIPKQKHMNEKKPHWLEIAIPALLRPKLREGLRYKIQFLVDDYSFALYAYDFDLNIIKNTSEDYDCVLNLPYEKLLALMSGTLSPKSLNTKEISSKKFTSRVNAIRWLQKVLC